MQGLHSQPGYRRGGESFSGCRVGTRGARPLLVMFILIAWSRGCPICLPWSYCFFPLATNMHSVGRHLRLCRQSAPHQYLSPDLASIDDASPSQSVLWWWQNDDYPAVTIPPHTPVGLAFCCKPGPSFPPPLCICFPLYCGLTGSNFLMASNLLLSLIILVLKLSPICPVEVPSCVLVTCTHHFFLVLFYFLALQNVPGSSCTYPVSTPEWAISPRSSGFF